jgi:hypothetical protein
LSTKRFEIARAEPFGQNRLGKEMRIVQDEQSTTAPFDDAAILFGAQHVVEASYKFV